MSRRPAACRARSCTPGLLVLVLAFALAACSLADRDVVSRDRAAGREVAVLSGMAPPEPPPAHEFRQFSALDAEASLRRLIVRPSTWASFLREEPQPLLSPDQLTWARAAIANHVPRLGPEQRLQLRFEDRFKGFEVEVEIYPQGRNLVYRFTLLAERPEVGGDRPATRSRFAQLQPQAGQELEYERDAVRLTDRVLAREGVDNLARNLALLDEAAADGPLDAEALAPARAVLEAHPSVSREAVRLYLDKLATVLKAADQGLFSPEEADSRKAALLDELRGATPAR